MLVLQEESLMDQPLAFSWCDCKANTKYMQIWHKNVTFTLPMAWLVREQECDRFPLCYREGINISDA